MSNPAYRSTHLSQFLPQLHSYPYDSDAPLSSLLLEASQNEDYLTPAFLEHDLFSQFIGLGSFESNQRLEGPEVIKDGIATATLSNGVLSRAR